MNSLIHDVAIDCCRMLASSRHRTSRLDESATMRAWLTALGLFFISALIKRAAQDAVAGWVTRHRVLVCTHTEYTMKIGGTSCVIILFGYVTRPVLLRTRHSYSMTRFVQAGVFQMRAQGPGTRPSAVVG